MLNFRRKKDLGDIVISERVIAQIVLKNIRKKRGRIFVVTDKGKRLSKIQKALGATEEDNVEVVGNINNLTIRVHIIVRLGVAINKTINVLIEDIKADIYAILGIVPTSISVIVSGIVSKKIAKRHMEVTKSYDE